MLAMKVLMQRARVIQPSQGSREQRRGEPNPTLEYLGEPVNIAVGKEVDVLGLEGLRFVYYKTHEGSGLSTYLYTGDRGGNFATRIGLDDECVDYISGAINTGGAYIDDIFYKPLILWQRDDDTIDLGAPTPEYVTTIRMERPPSLGQRVMASVGQIFSRTVA